MSYIYHITDEETWKNYSSLSIITHFSLETEGLIHCCDYGQIKTVIKRFFKDEKTIYAFKINTEILKNELKYEESDNELFPHIYGPINTDAIEEKLIFKNLDGQIEEIK